MRIDDAASFAERTVALLRDAGLRAALAEKARRLVQERYDWRQIGGRFVELVEQTANRTRATRRSQRLT